MIFADFSKKKKIATVCRKCIPFLFLIHIPHSVIQILLGKAHTFGCKIFCLHGSISFRFFGFITTSTNYFFKVCVCLCINERAVQHFVYLSVIQMIC